MKRTIPLLIAGLAGCVLIASRFIPITGTWGQLTAIWFDVLEAIAFILGGGSLLKLQLKKVSDRQPGWGYSIVILVAFLATLFVGLGKIGVPPNPEQQFYGASLAPLRVDDLPEAAEARVAGAIPQRADGEPLPLAVKRQLSEQNGQLVFRGWMTPQQKGELSSYKETLAWQCTVERLYREAQPPPSLKGKIAYDVNHSALSCRGAMEDDVREALLRMSGNEKWKEAVHALDEQSRVEVRVLAPQVPDGFEIPAEMRKFIFYDKGAQQLGIRGRMSLEVRDALAREPFAIVRPTTADERARFRRSLESQGGPLNLRQASLLEATLKNTWTVDQLRKALESAGKAVAPPVSACELQQAQSGRPPTAPPRTKAPDLKLNDRQQAILDKFATAGGGTPGVLAARLRSAGPFNERQSRALAAFFAQVPTVGEQKRDLCVALLEAGPLSREQRHFLLADYREQFAWRQIVGDLFVRSNPPRYPWSGQYNISSSAFGWLYEFVFKPLTATIFSLLAFYVASAAFRAFRAKNLEAILLLGTAFIILLGQTFAGYWLTAWIPERGWASLFRIENLRMLISQVFQTAGQRAIMIGIALGLAATSLKVLLGIDRSYLGTGED